MITNLDKKNRQEAQCVKKERDISNRWRDLQEYKLK